MFEKTFFDPLSTQGPQVPQKSCSICFISFISRTNKKFGIKIFEIDFVIEILMIFDLWTPPRAPGGKAKFLIAVATPIHVSNSHTKFGWIPPNGLGGDSITDRRRQ